MKKKFISLFLFSMFFALSLVPVFHVKQSENNASASNGISQSIFIRTPTYSTIYDEKIYFIDSYDNLLKCYNTSTNLFENKTLDLSTYGNILTATAKDSHIIALTKNTNNEIKLLDLNLTSFTVEEIIDEKLTDDYVQLHLCITDSSFIITLTPVQITATISPLVISASKNTFELENICEIQFNTQNNQVVAELKEKLYKIFFIKSENNYNLVYFYGHNITYSPVQLTNIQQESLTIANCQNPYTNLENEISVVSLAGVNEMTISGKTYFLVSYSGNKQARIQAINRIYNFNPSTEVGEVVFRYVDYEQCENTKYILTNNEYIIYPLNQTIVYKQMTYNESAEAGSDKYPVVSGDIDNPAVSVTYFDESEFIYSTTKKETTLVSSPWSAEPIDSIPQNTDIIRIGKGFIEPASIEITDYAYVLYTVNNVNKKGYVKLSDIETKDEILVNDYDFTVATVVPNTNLYSLPTNIVGDSITNLLISSKRQIKANSVVKVINTIGRYSANGSVFVKVVVNDIHEGYIQLKDVIMPSEEIDFIKTNATILKDGTKVYSEASKNSEVKMELQKDKMVYVDGVRDTKTGLTKIIFNDEFGNEITGYIETDYVKTNSWSTLQIVGCVLIAINTGLLVLILIFKKEHIGKYGQKFEKSKKPNYKENKLVSEE
ncbi:MAG: hypothetical protein IKB06_04275 [Clostridia bacterium]|nr:hypothetical protein [Clostridia bacterium]